MNKAKSENILVCGAWPYANGSLHIGHVAALLAGDVVSRFHRLNGDNVLYVSGSDQHGTPIVVRAEQEGVTPASIAEKYHQEFVRDFKKLGFSYNLYSKTTEPKHTEVVQEFFLDLYEKKVIYEKTQELLYCPKCQRFLPDRYVEGTCPKCGAAGARGDQCDECGSLLDSTELLEPKCKTCGTTPELRESEHFFLKLSEFGEYLEKYIKEVGPKNHWRPNAVNFSLGLIKEGLPDRAITRDTEWGVPIPLEGYENKRIYVWFEAVLGYVSTSIKWAEDAGQPEAWKPFWSTVSQRIYAHGKDNIPFHTIILPSILKSKGNLGLPSQILSTEYVTLEGKQLSTSRNWAVWVPDFLEKYDPDSLRYYCINNGPETADADFSWTEFVERNNSDLVGTYGNLVHRVLTFSQKHFGNEIPAPGKLESAEKELLAAIDQAFKETAKQITEGSLRKALKTIFGLARLGNQYIDKKAPWQEIKTSKKDTATTLWTAFQVIGALAALTKPFLPRSAQELQSTLNLKDLHWSAPELKPGQPYGEPKPLFANLDEAIAQEELLKLQS